MHFAIPVATSAHVWATPSKTVLLKRVESMPKTSRLSICARRSNRGNTRLPQRQRVRSGGSSEGFWIAAPAVGCHRIAAGGRFLRRSSSQIHAPDLRRVAGPVSIHSSRSTLTNISRILLLIEFQPCRALIVLETAKSVTSDRGSFAVRNPAIASEAAPGGGIDAKHVFCASRSGHAAYHRSLP